MKTHQQKESNQKLLLRRLSGLLSASPTPIVKATNFAAPILYYIILAVNAKTSGKLCI